MKKTHDYDSTFKTLKSRHKRLFISVINEAFHKNYSMDGKIEVLSSEGFFVDSHKADEEYPHSGCLAIPTLTDKLAHVIRRLALPSVSVPLRPSFGMISE